MTTHTGLVLAALVLALPSAIRVESCNCGERLECRVRTSGDQVELEVREDASTSTRCRDCVSAEAACPILRPLAPGHAVVRLNDLVDVRLDTSEAGLLAEGRCWDVPARR
ncbi:MAG: hypothetical protein HYY06_19135 [Deltaproteobacteria bacterium]|nr:hypothetical protein [Deltaproteobacteria bacterium]